MVADARMRRYYRVNAYDTVLEVRNPTINALESAFRPRFLVTPGSALEHARDAFARQSRKQRHIRLFRGIGSFVVIFVCVLMFGLEQLATAEFWMATAVLAVFCTGFAFVTDAWPHHQIDGIEVFADEPGAQLIFDNLTPAEREALLRASDDSTAVLNAVRVELIARYTAAQVHARQQREEQAARRARELLEGTGPDPI